MARRRPRGNIGPMRQVAVFLAIALSGCSSSGADLGTGGSDATTDSAHGDGGASETGSTGDGAPGVDSGASNDGASNGDTGTSSNACSFADGGAFYPPITFAVCHAQSECALLFHQIDCCGSKKAYGVLQSKLADFQAAEQRWEAECAKCGCDPKATVTQDGKSGPDNTITVDCVTDPVYPPGTCQSLIP